jgi:hypothetical protein
MARFTIKVPEEVGERHNERREEMGLTWAEYLDSEAPHQEDMIRRVVREELEAVSDTVGGTEDND